ncbi:MAG: hypothetical protein KatS3mg024_0165 [Armatimonadota bacterium]|nr:MAG: hypothetical protein KatS3mg024_0165 [Armatimonadota bacterium]
MRLLWRMPVLLALVMTMLQLGVPAMADGPYELLVVSSNNRVLRFDPDGRYRGVFTADPGLIGPLGIAVGPDGKVYVSAESSGRASVRRYSSDGTFEREYYTFSLSSPFGVALDAANNLYVSSYSGDEVVRWLASGAYDGTFASSGGMDGPAGICFDSQGRLYVACDMYGQDPPVKGRVLKFGPTGAFESQILMDNLYVYPSDVAVDSAGDVYVLVTIGKPNNAVIRYGPDGSNKAYYAFPAINAPIGIALHPDTNQVYVTGEEGVYRWDQTSGQQLVVASGQSGLSRPMDIAFRPLQPAAGNTITYQGKLTNPQGQAVEDGTYTLVVRFYQEQEGGTPLWQSLAVSVQVKQGLFTARFSKVPADVFSARNVWMETEVNGETITPRRYIGSVPLSIRAPGN